MLNEVKMLSLFDVNGLIFWTAPEIRLRNQMIETFAAQVETVLLAENPAWRFFQVEAPMLTPTPLLNPNYTDMDVYQQMLSPLADRHGIIQWYRDNSLTLRPETTPGSYAYARHILNTHTGVKAPLCVWQAGKSFRREHDQPSKFMRLKEFYQQEFQCIYSIDTLNDYQEAVLRPIMLMLAAATGLQARVVDSDRLPAYSERTVDVELLVDQYEEGITDNRWMEVCSISRRTDFPDKLQFPAKKGIGEKEARVLEIAIGLDRLLYARERSVNAMKATYGEPAV
jgi:glycyl-tRNA synthetase